MKKRGAAFGMALVLAALSVNGCAAKAQTKNYDIYTGDPDALRIYVRGYSTYAENLEKQFPDIKFDFYYYGGLNPTMSMNQLMELDKLGDICVTSLQLTDDEADAHLLDLSGNPICGRYEASMLSQFDVDGSIYQLPGYVTMRDIIYNQDMFEQHGWKEPQSFGELVELCRQIRRETTGITPIVMAGAANGYYFTTMTSYAQAEFLYTPEGQKWCKAFRKGEAKAEDGFGAGIEMTQELIDAGAFDYDANFGLWDRDLFEARMLTGEAAMMFAWGGQTELLRLITDNPQIQFKLMPFRNRSGQAFIGTNISYYIGLAKSLGERGNEKKLEQAMRVLDWFSTEEGILALSQDTKASVLPIKNGKNESALPLYTEFWSEHLDSIKAPMMYAGYEDIITPAADVILDAVQGKGRLDHLAECIDETHQKYLAGGANAIQVGSFAKDFTHKETVQFFANLLKHKGETDIALVSDGTYKNGVLNRGGAHHQFFEGGILDDQLTINIPGMTMHNKAVKMTLTGKQVKDLLENGKYSVSTAEGVECTIRTEHHPDATSEASFDYYWSGMDVKWKNGRVQSMRLGDGRELGDDDTCTAAFAYQDYTLELEEAAKPQELSYTVLEAYEDYLKEFSPVSPVAPVR